MQSGGCTTSVRLDYVNDTKLPKLKLLNQTSPSLPGTFSHLIIKNTYLGSRLACVLGDGNYGKREIRNGKSGGKVVTSHDFLRAKATIPSARE